MSDKPWRARNVVWVFGDQHRAQSLGHAGDPNLATPHADRMASTGAALNGVSGWPLCCPYRGSLMTSRYCHEAVPGHERPLDPSLPTVATAFRDAGFHTAWFGKWHLDGHRERDGRAALHTVPRERRGGFDRWLGYENNNSQIDVRLHGHDDDGREVPHFKLDGHETGGMTGLFLDHLRRRRDDGGRFFAVLSLQPPHDPYVAPIEFARRHNPATVQLRPNVPPIAWVEERARSDLAGYHAMIEDIDRHLGRILEAVGDDTAVIFFSDHGDMHGSHGQFRKTTPWEESVRVPMLIAGPPSRYAVQAGARRPDVLVNHVDLLPTSLGLCGLDAPDWCRGADLSGHFLREKDAPVPDSAYLQLVEPTGHGDSVDRPWRGLVTADGWKYVCLPGVPWLMFDLNSDPHERVNLAHNTRFGDRRRQLNERLRRWVAETGDAFDLPAV